jgi:RimJ/RimL family protein N-acetyltransferase
VANEALVVAVIWLRDNATGETGTSAPALVPSDAAKASNSDAINSLFTFTTGKPLRSEWGTAIGVIQLSHLTPTTTHHRRTEIGISILPAFPGRGYGREDIEWALDYAFRRAGLHRVRAFEWNAGALRLYEKIGLTIEGRAKEAFSHMGWWWFGVETGMLEGEWWGIRREREGKEKGV